MKDQHIVVSKGEFYTGTFGADKKYSVVFHGENMTPYFESKKEAQEYIDSCYISLRHGEYSRKYRILRSNTKLAQRYLNQY